MAASQDEDLSRALSQTYPSIKLNGLCKLCRSIIERSKNFQGLTKAREEETFEHYSSLSELEASANQDCHFCSLLFAPSHTLSQYIQHSDSGSLKLSIGSHSARNWEYKVDNIAFSVSLIPNAPSAELYVCSAEQLFDEHQYPKPNQQVIPRSWSTAADDCFDLARFWLHDCRTNHAGCNQTPSDIDVPSRLVRICDDPLRLKLVLTKDAPADLEYCALSYKWGERQPGSAFLMGDSISQLMLGISLISLPRTLQDAVVAAYKLGYRYIWVDRLCIDQESSEDFHAEAAKMGQYYQRASLNIAALDSSSAAEGCFTTRNPLGIQPCMIANPKGAVYLNAYANRDLSAPWLEEGSSAAQLITRAWVVQEKLLSPRTLYYGHNGVFWECRTHSASENLPYSNKKDEHPFFPENTLGASRQPSTGLSKEVKSRKAVWFDFLHSLDSPTATTNFKHAWSNLVFHYTSCAMTDKRDRLVAIAGIVDSISRQTGRKATYAMWHETLPLELAWRREDDGGTEVDEAQVIRMPRRSATWSWGYISTPIRISLDGDMMYQFVGATYIPTCQARVIDTPVEVRSLKGEPYKVFACEVELELPMLKATCVAGSLQAEHGANMGRYTADVDIKEGSAVWMCPLARRGPFKRSMGARVGILLRSWNKDRNLWKRCGWFRKEGPVWLAPGADFNLDGKGKKDKKKNTIILV